VGLNNILLILLVIQYVSGEDWLVNDQQ